MVLETIELEVIWAPPKIRLKRPNLLNYCTIGRVVIELIESDVEESVLMIDCSNGEI
jgi:hypothetical protein